MALVTVGIVASGCSPTKEAASTATATTEASAEKAPATTTHAAASTDLKSLVLRQRWDKRDLLRLPAVSLSGTDLDLAAPTEIFTTSLAPLRAVVAGPMITAVSGYQIGRAHV